MIKNHRAILRSNIRALPVQGRRIMVRPENVEKLIVTDLRRIEFHFYGLSVSGLIGADIFIGRILLCPPYVPDRCGQNALQIAESFFHSPETACAECGFLRLHTKMMKRLRGPRNHGVARPPTVFAGLPQIFRPHPRCRPRKKLDKKIDDEEESDLPAVQRLWPVV